MNTYQDIIRQHPQSVALFFSRYGHANVPVTEATLAAMMVKYKQPLINDIAVAISNNYDVYQGADGGIVAKLKRKIKPVGSKIKARTTPRPQVDRTVVRTSMPDRITTVMQAPPMTIPIGLSPTINTTNIVQQPDPAKKSIFDRVKSILETVLPIVNGVKEVIKPMQNDPVVDKILTEPAAQKKKNKTLLYIGIAVVVVLAVAMYILRNKKTIK